MSLSHDEKLAIVAFYMRLRAIGRWVYNLAALLLLGSVAYLAFALVSHGNWQRGTALTIGALVFSGLAFVVLGWGKAKLSTQFGLQAMRQYPPYMTQARLEALEAAEQEWAEYVARYKEIQETVTSQGGLRLGVGELLPDEHDKILEATRGAHTLEEAVARVEIEAGRDPHDWVYQWYLCWQYSLELGRFDEGVRHADRILALAPDEPRTLFAAANAYYRVSVPPGADEVRAVNAEGVAKRGQALAALGMTSDETVRQAHELLVKTLQCRLRRDERKTVNAHLQAVHEEYGSVLAEVARRSH